MNEPCTHKHEVISHWYGTVAVIVCADCGEELGEKDYE